MRKEVDPVRLGLWGEFQPERAYCEGIGPSDASASHRTVRMRIVLMIMRRDEERVAARAVQGSVGRCIQKNIHLINHQ